MSNPRIGRAAVAARAQRSSTVEELLEAPQAVEVGTISDTKLTNPSPSFQGWESADAAGTPVQIDVQEPPPPWETDPRYLKHDTDARRFVDVPQNWELRWLNPRMVARAGLRDWQQVSYHDDRVKVRPNAVAMKAPDGSVRRGSHGDGDFLAWMYKHWVDSRSRLKAEHVRRMTQRAVDRQRQVRDELARGSFGSYVQVTDARHPTHTIGDGKTMKD